MLAAKLFASDKQNDSELDPSARETKKLKSKFPSYSFKVIVLGSPGTGKSSIVLRYVKNKFYVFNYFMTLGRTIYEKIVQREDCAVELRIHDFTGQDTHARDRYFYENALGAVILYDITRPETFESLHHWKTTLDSMTLRNGGLLLPCILLGNKCDLEEKIPLNHCGVAKEYSRAHGYYNWFETSALSGKNVESAFTCLIDEMIATARMLRRRPIRPFGFGDEETTGQSCCIS